MKRPVVHNKKLIKGFAKLIHMCAKKFCLQKHLIFMITALSIMMSPAYAQELETPLITNVQVSPDQKQIVIKGDKALGTHSAFAFENPYRLVIDFEDTGLGKVPLKIKIDKPPMNEIRLGKNGHRTRLVVDFGEYPVPPFMVERKGNIAVVALGNVPTDPRMIQKNSKVEAGSKSYHAPTPQPQVHIAPKKQSISAPTSAGSPVTPHSTAVKKNEQSSFIVKQSLVTNNLLLVELQDRKLPSETYRIVVDLNLNDMTVRNASISNSGGVVKRFDLVESGSKVAQDNTNPEESSHGHIAIGPRKKSNPSIEENPDNRQKYSWGAENPASSEANHVDQQPVNSNPFKLQKFELKSKGAGSAKLDD